MTNAAAAKDKKLCQLLIDKGANVDKTLDLLDENIFDKKTKNTAALKKAFEFLLKHFNPSKGI